jgi:hypothetical protein
VSAQRRNNTITDGNHTPAKPDELILTVKRLNASGNVFIRASDGWRDHFFNRYPQLSLRFRTDSGSLWPDAHEHAADPIGSLGVVMNQHTEQMKTTWDAGSLLRTKPALPLIIALSFTLFAHVALATPESIGSGLKKETGDSARQTTPRQTTLTMGNHTSVHTYTTPFLTTANKLTPAISSTPDRHTASYSPSLWIFDVTLNLHTDYDQDGHYSNFNLTLDLDTSFAATTVYAVLYLASEGGPWNEYAVTGNFTVSGRGSADTFSLHAELDSGYPSGYYNHYIEIYDAYTHELIGLYGPEDSWHLYGLPIESRAHDSEFTFGTDISLSFSGTGSIGPGLIALLASGIVMRRRQNRRTAVSGRHSSNGCLK